MLVNSHASAARRVGLNSGTARPRPGSARLPRTRTTELVAGASRGPPLKGLVQVQLRFRDCAAGLRREHMRSLPYPVRDVGTFEETPEVVCVAIDPEHVARGFLSTLDRPCSLDAETI